jgi:hypothetical protein
MTLRKASTAIFLLIYAGLCAFWARHVPVFWDAHVYAHAIYCFRHGVNPYLEDSNTRFVYSPAFLMLTPYLGRFGWNLYIFLSIGAAVSIPFLIAQYLRKTWIASVAILIFVLIPGFYSEMTLLSGNISNILYFAILCSGLVGVRKEKWFAFYVAVVIASVIKPPFLTFLLLPLLITGAWVRVIVSMITVAAVFGAQRLAMPTLFAGFQEAVHSQLLTHQDMGIGIASYFPGSLLWLIPYVLILGITVVYLWQSRKICRDSDLWIPSILIVCIVGNPRMLGYDVIVAMIPAVYIVVQAIREWSESPAAIGVGISAFMLIFSRHASVGTFVFLLTALLLSLLVFHQHNRAFNAGKAIEVELDATGR